VTAQGAMHVAVHIGYHRLRAENRPAFATFGSHFGAEARLI
jgi:hypothetical protein